MWKILSDGSAHNPDAFARLLIKRKVVIYSDPFHGMNCLGVFKKTGDAKEYIKSIVDRYNKKAEEKNHDAKRIDL